MTFCSGFGSNSIAALLWRYRFTGAVRSAQAHPFACLAFLLAVAGLCAVIASFFLIPLFRASHLLHFYLNEAFGPQLLIAANHGLHLSVWMLLFVPSVLQLQDTSRKSGLWHIVIHRLYTPKALVSLVRNDTTAILLAGEVFMLPLLYWPVRGAATFSGVWTYLGIRLFVLLLLRVSICSVFLAKAWVERVFQSLILQWLWLLVYVSLLCLAAVSLMAGNPVVTVLHILRFFLLLQTGDATLLLLPLLAALLAFEHYWLLSLAELAHNRGAML